MKQCTCGNKEFNTIFQTEVTFRLDEEGTLLKAIDENDLGGDGIYTCQKCDKEYQSGDFNDIDYILK